MKDFVMYHQQPQRSTSLSAARKRDVLVSNIPLHTETSGPAAFTTTHVFPKVVAGFE
jgi:hypothetical protein